jgi:hypothetical protein
MAKRGRVSAAEREMKALVRKSSTPQLVINNLEPPPPPPDLEQPEKDIWLTVSREFTGTATAFHVLRSALRMHRQARKAIEIAEREGMVIVTERGSTQPHPMIAAARQAQREFTNSLRLLKLKL